MGRKGVAKELGAADVRAERSRHRITQAELATEVGYYTQTMTLIEAEKIELSEAEYQRLLDGIEAIVARRKVEAEA